MPEPYNPNPSPPAGAVSERDAAPSTDTGTDSFDKAFYEKELAEARGQAANYRTQWAPFRDAYAGYDEDETNEWLELGSLLKSNPKEAAERFRSLADQLSPAEIAAAVAEAAAVTPVPPVDDADEDRPMTRREFNAMKAADAAEAQTRFTAQAEEAEVNRIYSEAKAIGGYEPQTKAMVDLLWTARNETNGSLEAAHAHLMANEDEIVRRHMDRVQEGNARVGAVSRGGVAPANEIQHDGSWSSAKERINARLRDS